MIEETRKRSIVKRSRKDSSCSIIISCLANLIRLCWTGLGMKKGNMTLLTLILYICLFWEFHSSFSSMILMKQQTQQKGEIKGARASWQFFVLSCINNFLLIYFFLFLRLKFSRGFGPKKLVTSVSSGCTRGFHECVFCLSSSTSYSGMKLLSRSVRICQRLFIVGLDFFFFFIFYEAEAHLNVKRLASTALHEAPERVYWFPLPCRPKLVQNGGRLIA